MKKGISSSANHCPSSSSRVETKTFHAFLITLSFSAVSGIEFIYILSIRYIKVIVYFCYAEKTRYIFRYKTTRQNRYKKTALENMANFQLFGNDVGEEE